MMSPKEQAMSRSTIGSSNASASQPRRSFQEPVPLGGSVTDTSNTPTQTPGLQGGTNDSGVFSDSERERRGPMGWIRGKIQERKERDAERRTRTPERNHSSANGRQEFGTPVHRDSIPERTRDASGQSVVNDTVAQPANVSGAAVAPVAVAPSTGNVPTTPAQPANASGAAMTPAVVAPSTSNVPTTPAQPPAVSEPVRTSLDAAVLVGANDTRQPSVPADPALNERIDAVMGSSK